MESKVSDYLDYGNLPLRKWQTIETIEDLIGVGFSYCWLNLEG